MIKLNAPIEYKESVFDPDHSFPSCSHSNYKLVVKKGILGKYKLKVYAGFNSHFLNLDFKVATRDRDIFEGMIQKALEKYPIFTISREDLCKYLGIY